MLVVFPSLFFSPVQIKYVDKEKEEENAILDQGAHI
jgi:hypothetical protein